jgi:hypothetical protein
MINGGSCVSQRGREGVPVITEESPSSEPKQGVAPEIDRKGAKI